MMPSPNPKPISLPWISVPVPCVPTLSEPSTHCDLHGPAYPVNRAGSKILIEANRMILFLIVTLLTLELGLHRIPLE